MPLYGYKKDGSKVKATKETPAYEKGEIVDGNPWNKKPEMFIKNKGAHVMPHWAHYEAPEGSIQYREDDVNAHGAGVELLGQFYGLSDDETEVWIKGETPEDTICPDLIYGKHFGIEVQHSNIIMDEFMRRNEAYLKNGLIPVWILHAEEEIPKYTSDHDENEKMLKNYNAFKAEYGTGNYCHKNGARYSREFSLSKKIERRLARIQGFVIYYEFDYSEGIIDPKIKLFAIEFEKAYKKKTIYYGRERYDLSDIENSEYVFGRIKERWEKFQKLRETQDYTTETHYKFDDAKEEWVPDSKLYHCSECGKNLWYPAKLNIDESVLKVRCEEHQKIAWNAKYPTWAIKSEFLKREYSRKTD